MIGNNIIDDCYDDCYDEIRKCHLILNHLQMPPVPDPRDLVCMRVLLFAKQIMSEDW